MELYYFNKYTCDITLKMIKNIEDTTHIELCDKDITGEYVKILAQQLKGRKITTLNVSFNPIGDKGARYLAEIVKDTQITSLNLSENEIHDEGAKSIAQHLKDSRVTNVNLSRNNIGYNGVKYLAEILKDTQITSLNLSGNNIGNEGAKYLAEILKDTWITSIDLTNNNIGIDGAQYLDLAQGNTKNLSLLLDVYYYTTGKFDVIRIISSYDSEMHHIAKVTLYGKGIGTNGANYLNQRFKDIPIVKLTLTYDILDATESHYLAQAFNNIEIMELDVYAKHIPYLGHIFRGSRIVKLNFHKHSLGIYYVELLVVLLKEINIIELDMSKNDIDNECVKYLVSGLKNNTIKKLILSTNDIRNKGAKYLAKILKDTQITNLDLSMNYIGSIGVKYLAHGLKQSQVTHLNLYVNVINTKGLQYLIDAIEATNLCWVGCEHVVIETGLGKENYNIVKNTFKRLVSLNSLTTEFEFIVPKTDTSDVNNYIFLIKSLCDNPNVKTHIFDMMYDNDYHGYDFNIMRKINKFITNIENKFNEFLNSNLLYLLQVFDGWNWINLIKQFQDVQLYSIVQNFLLHRELYYVDENNEILHPYIYKMLKEYNMTLYNEKLEPYKKEAIISYYKIHSEIDGAQEIIDLLEQSRPESKEHLTLTNISGHAGHSWLSLTPFCKLYCNTMQTFSYRLHNSSEDDICSFAVINNIEDSTLTRKISSSNSFSNQTNLNQHYILHFCTMELYYFNKYTCDITLKMIKNIEDTTHIELCDKDITGEYVKILAQQLKGRKITTLNVSFNPIGDKGARYLAEIVKDTQITSLNLSENEIHDEGAKSIAQHLKDSRVTNVNLSRNNIGYNGVKYLAEILKDTQITSLNLSGNNIGNEGAKYLAEILKDTRITSIDLTNNNIGIDGAQYLDLAQGNTKNLSLLLDVYYYTTGKFDVIRIISSYDSEMHHIAKVTLYGKGIGTNGANYLNQRFKDIPIVKLTLTYDILDATESHYLAQAFNNIEIMELDVYAKHIPYLGHIFRGSRIVKLNFHKHSLGIYYVELLVVLLKEINIIELDMSKNDIDNECVKYLVSGLKNNTIKKLILSTNDIRNKGAKYLAKILKDTQITNLDLSMNYIGSIGVKYLAHGLKQSQVTHLNLYVNVINTKGLQYLIDAIEATNLCWVGCEHVVIETGLGKENYNIVKNTFKRLVSLNSLTTEFEFIVPKTDTSDVNNYIFLIKSLCDNPNVKTHIFDMMYDNDYHGYDFNIMRKINKFITNIENKFNEFLNSNLLYLLQVFDGWNWINLIKQFQDVQLYSIVQNFLLHRELYYVDENNEILHPYIYKMLKEYNMTLYNEKLEPYKKEAIISYYKIHSEIDGAQEIIDLLEQYPIKKMINLKDRKYFVLCNNNNINDEDVKSLAERLKDSQVSTVDLSCNNIGDKGAKHLAEILKYTQITNLVLSRNGIGDEGAKSIAQHLKNSQVTDLNLSGNNIGHRGAKYLAEILKETEITSIDLRENNIGIIGAQCLDLAQNYTKRCSLYIDVNYCPNTYNYFRIISSYNSEMHHIAYVFLYGNRIGIEGGNYLNQRFKNIPIVDLTLDSDKLDEIDSQYLAQAFNDIEIMNLIIRHRHIMQTNGVKYLVQIFRGSRIVNLNLNGEKLGSSGAKCVAEFLKEIDIIDFDIGRNCIRAEGVKHLISGLKNNTIRKLTLSSNSIRHEGAKYLAEILKVTQITNIDLRNNYIGIDGAKYLANGLKYSQVTHLSLDVNMINNEGFQYLSDSIEDTNLSSVDLEHSYVGKGFVKGTKLVPRAYNIPRNTISVADNIKNAFKDIVSMNPLTMEFEFIIPRRDISALDVDTYVFFIKSLSDNPNVKAHIFDMMCHNDSHGYDFNIMSKINEFVTKTEDKFNAFINSHLLDLLQMFDGYNWVNLVKQFQDMGSYDIVQNLLLHRELYYIDENQEILHPYIYKMLNKYNMPLYSEELEPNKKETIIYYYKNHSEIDGALEIIDLLGSVSFR
ncbi:uncharacterized protein LOC142332450 [Lycorma delicatula]|uniref:uncharacterized protein LOC142332450 n=1 Tax=Lycorma delicatula TaxID=130591 RepID=UPI003F50EF18